jgi:iron complex outermembrane receptor protein
MIACPRHGGSTKWIAAIAMAAQAALATAQTSTSDEQLDSLLSPQHASISETSTATAQEQTSGSERRDAQKPRAQPSQADPSAKEGQVLQVITVQPLSKASAEQPAPDQPRARGIIEEIIVTAQRKSESLQDVPMAISAFSADQLERAGIESASDLTIMTPGVQIGSGYGNALVYMRGIGNNIVVAGSESSNAFYMDDVYYADASGVLTSFNNVERIEVLKGPQGTLYGRNATGGLIHIITPDPQLGPLLNVKLGYEDYETIKGSLYATGGLSEALKASLAVNIAHQGEGYGRNLTLDKEILFIEHQNYRAKALWEPTESDRITFAGSYFRNTGDMGLQGTVYPGRRSITDATYSGPHNSQAGRLADHLTEAEDVSLRWEHYFDNGMTLKSVSAYRGVNYLVRDADGDEGELPVLFFGFLKDQQSFQQELLVQGDVDWLDRLLSYTSGVFYFNNDGLFATPVTALPTNDLLTSTPGLALIASLLWPVTDTAQVAIDQYARTKTQSLAAYSQADYQLNERNTLTAGLRYTLDWLEEETGESFIGVPGGSAQGQSSYGQLTWRLAVKHNFTDQWMAFASFSRGYKSGQYNGVGDGSYLALGSDIQQGLQNLAGRASPQAVRPEILDAYEVGSKATMLNGSLQLGLNAFFYDYQDLQITTVYLATPSLRNAAQAKIYGAELELVWSAPVPLGQLLLHGNAGLLENEFTDFPDCNFWSYTPVIVIGAGTASTQNCTGNELPFAAPYNLTVGLDYVTPSVVGGQLGASVTYYRNGGYFLGAENVMLQKPYNAVSAELSHTLRDDRMRMRVYGKNLTDERVWTFCSANNFASNCRAGPPRTVGFELEYTWGS